MAADQTLADRLLTLGHQAAGALYAIQEAKRRARGPVPVRPGATEVGLGALNPRKVNIVVHGHVPPLVVRGLAEAAPGAPVEVDLAALCGADAGGEPALPVLANYDSQEAVLLTGAVDLLVVGRQCVMPAMISLARQQGVAVIQAGSLQDEAACRSALETAREAFRRRAGKATAVPPGVRPLHVGAVAAVGLADALRAGFVRDAVKGLVYFGGCGSIANTQDALPVQLARQLVKEGHVLVAAGCAGISLAKAGMTDPDYDGGNPVLKGALPPGMSPVLYLGACHDAAAFMTLAEGLGGCGLPVFAVLPEVTHHKTLATAAAFVARGIPAAVGLESLFADATVKAALGEGKAAAMLPLAELARAPRACAAAGN